MTAAEAGTAHHRFLEWVDLARVDSVPELEAEARRLEREGVLLPAERAALDLETIASFWASAIGRKLLGHREKIHRELPFTARLSGAELAMLLGAQPAHVAAGAAPPGPANVLGNLAGLPDEFVIVQGVVDLAVMLPDEIWLLDFKTDAVSEADWRMKAREYAPQLKLYAHALSRIYHRPVTHCGLHFLSVRRTIECGEIS